MSQSLVIGNWKMNGTVGETLKLIAELQHKLPDPAIEVVIAPPFTALYSAHVALQDTPFLLAAQNMHWESDGAFTGEVSATFLKDIGCAYVLIGHSERRQYFGETDETVNRKVQSALIHELIPVVCVGETLEQRESGKTEAVLEAQLKKAFQKVSMQDLKDLVLAYEPVWAIGTGKVATNAEIEGALQCIRNTIAKIYDAPTAHRLKILYGGSVTPETAKSIALVPGVNGFLVGGASLSIEKFAQIVKTKN